MSLKGQALRDLVMERLVVAADEIFALFERTIAEYEEEALRSRLQLQEPRVVLHKEDVQAVSVSVEVGPSPEHIIKEEQTLCVKQEEEPPLKFPFTAVSVKTEDIVDKCSLLRQEPAEEDRADAVGEPCEGEEPGCSLDLPSENEERTCSSLDTDNSNDWEPPAKRSTKCDGQEPNEDYISDSQRGGAAGNCGNSFINNISNTVMNNDLHGRERKPKPHRCSECYKTFQCEVNFQKHLLIHARQTPFRCQICNKTFSYKSSYKQHLLIHTDEKPYSCSFCNRGFTQKCHLKEHMRIHTGEKPFSCPDCGVRFRQQNSVLRHILSVHRGDKPYTCPVCQRGFVQKGYYVIHMRTHTGERPFSCTICDKSFGAKGSLKKHISVHRAHGEIKNEVLE